MEKNLIVIEPRMVPKIAGDDPRPCYLDHRILPCCCLWFLGDHGEQCPFPIVKVACRRDTHRRIGMLQAVRIGVQ